MCLLTYLNMSHQFVALRAHCYRLFLSNAVMVKMQLTVCCMVSNAACSQSQSASHSSLLADETLLTNVMCGVLSGVISSSIANPTDVLKVAF